MAQTFGISMEAAPVPLTSGVGKEILAQEQAPLSDAHQELDLLDLLAFAWRNRVGILVGATTGILGTGVLSSVLMRESHVYSLNMRMDISSLPAINEPKVLMGVLSGALSSPGLLEKFWNQVKTKSPEFQTQLEESKWDVRRLISTQLKAEKPKDLVISFKQSDSGASPSARDYVFQFQLPVAQFLVVPPKVLSDSLNQMVETYNSEVESQALFTTQTVLNETQKGLTAAQEELSKERYKHEVRVVQIRQKLSMLEHRLKSKLRGTDQKLNDGNANVWQLGSLIGMLSRASSPEMIGFRGLTQDHFESRLRLENIIRLSGILREENQIGEKEYLNFGEQVAKISLEMQSEHSFISRINAVEISLSEKLSESMKKKAFPFDKSSQFLPKFELNTIGDEPGFQKVSGTKSKVGMLVLGAFLGGALAFMALGMVRFLRLNWNRIQNS
jgi:hypothetical protein